jgi:ABC-type uncharacterized transport system permease subunit
MSIPVKVVSILIAFAIMLLVSRWAFWSEPSSSFTVIQGGVDESSH